ncbi:MAG: type I methionyl aminopeptidase [Oscillospiraceae bacterium]|nr:type I methionyl aminopeptidase [Oscillospiraceae bacterium]
MIRVKSPREIERMRRAGRVAALALRAGGEAVRPGMTTAQVCKAVCRVIENHGAVPTFLNYRGFPGGCCVSVNEELIHGIPGNRKLREGDIVSIDAGATLDGYVGDTAATFPVGCISDQAARLIEVTEDCFWAAADKARRGARVSDISKELEGYSKRQGFEIVKQYTGHGVGKRLHEDPEIPNFWDGSRGARLIPGMTLAIEPMVNLGSEDVEILSDGWTVVTTDGQLSSHYEHTLLVTQDAPEFLTLLEG